MAPANRHASLVIAGESGVLITGPSGSGKTELALAFMAHCTAHGRFARLVSDDQVFLSAAAGRLIGRAPPTIAGLAEARGFGPAAIAHQSRAVVDLVVRLVAAEAAPPPARGRGDAPARRCRALSGARRAPHAGRGFRRCGAPRPASIFLKLFRKRQNSIKSWQIWACQRFVR